MFNMTNMASRLGYLQRGHLANDAKKSNGNMSVGTSGVNTGSILKQPEMTKLPGDPGQAATMQKMPRVGVAASPLVKFLSKMSGGAGLGKTGSSGSNGNTGVGAAAVGMQAALGAAGQGATATTKGTEQGFTFSGDYLADANKLMTQLQQIVNTPYNFDYKTDPTYIAAVEEAKKGAAQATDNTVATMADRGILNSSVTSNQLGQIEQEAKEAPLRLIPGLEENAYNRHQQGINNQASLVQTLMQQGQWQAGFQADERWKEADTTGTYESPEMRKIMEDIVGAKEGWAGATSDEDRKKYKESGKSARAALTALTGRSDIEKLFGATVGTDQARANFGMGGIETMAAKQYREEAGRWQTEFDNGNTQWNKEFTTRNTQWDKEYNQRERLSRSSGGGGGGGGPSSKAMNSNADMMLLKMKMQGIDTPEKAMEWINSNIGDVMSGNVDVGTLLSAVDKLGKGAAGGGGGTEMELYLKAVDLAKSDPLYKQIEGDDPAAFDSLVDKHLNKLKSFQGGPKGLTQAEKDQMELNHKVQWLSRY